MASPTEIEHKQRDFFETVRARYEEAGAHAEIVDFHYRIAGTRVQLSFAGPRLVSEITPALEHLRVAADAEPDLKVSLWDSASTGVSMPRPPCNQRNFTNRGNIWGFDSPRYRSAFHYGEFSVNLMDTEEDVALFWIRDADELPFWVNASPLRSIFHWWMEKNGKQLIHAAGIGTEEGAVALTARGGSGKSTTSLLCLDDGMQYLADDYLVLEMDPEPRLHSLYCTAKLDPDQLANFPHLAESARIKSALGYEKAVMYLYPALAEQIRDSLPLNGVLVPSITDGDATRLDPIDALSIEQAVSFTTISHLPHAGQHTVNILRRFSEEIPGMRLSLGADLAQIPPVVRNAIEEREVSPAAKPKRAEKDPLPLISVVIPVYNGAKFIREAVDNVLSENYPRLEIIMVDDGSTDESREIIEALPHEICRYEFKANLGPAEARNRGVRESAADYIAFLDVDDLWPEATLHRLMNIMRDRPEVDVVKGAGQLMQYDAGRGKYIEVEVEDPFPFYVSAALFKRSAFQRVGPFDRELRFGEDSDWFLRAQEESVNVLWLDEVTLQVRRHDSNMTLGKTKKELNALRVFKKCLDRKRARQEESPRDDSASVAGR